MSSKGSLVPADKIQSSFTQAVFWAGVRHSHESPRHMVHHGHNEGLQGSKHVTTECGKRLTIASEKMSTRSQLNSLHKPRTLP